MPEVKAYYLCDPEKNTACKKTGCHINGGPCSCTTHIEYAKQPVKTVRLIVPVTRADASEMGLLKDMHEGCELAYEEMLEELNEGLITQEAFNYWYQDHCEQCKYMQGECMYEGEA